jgi:TetR/AcrR family transcriptional regulator, transcriptional repressor for nem operon
MKRLTKRKQALKARLLASSSAVAKQKGFAALTVDRMMSGVDRTGSAFYTLFDSKTEMLNVLIEHELAQSVQRFSDTPKFAGTFDGWLGKARKTENKDPVDEWVAKVLKPYFSPHHVASPDEGCALPALSTEIARIGTEAKVAYEDALAKIVDGCSKRIGCSDATAWAVVAQCVGAVIVARSLASEEGKQMLLQSTADFMRSALKNEVREIQVTGSGLRANGSRARL